MNMARNPFITALAVLALSANLAVAQQGPGPGPAPGSSASGANPSASVGTSAVNGSATTFLRSDGAPAISQSIAPTWTGVHTFTPAANTSPIVVNSSMSGSSTAQSGINVTTSGSTSSNINGVSWFSNVSGTVGSVFSTFLATWQYGGTDVFRMRADGTLIANGVGVGVVSYSSSLQNSGTGRVVLSATAPSAPSSCGTSPSVAAANGTAAFTVNVGTGGTAQVCTVTMPTATTGWICSTNNITTTSSSVFITKQTATTTTSVTFGNFTTSGVAGAWSASDVIQLSCTAY